MKVSGPKIVSLKKDRKEKEADEATEDKKEEESQEKAKEKGGNINSCLNIESGNDVRLLQ